MARKYCVISCKDGAERVRLDVRVLFGVGDDFVQDTDIWIARSAIVYRRDPRTQTSIAEGWSIIGGVLLIQWRGRWRHRQMRRLPRVVAGGMKIDNSML